MHDPVHLQPLTTTQHYMILRDMVFRSRHPSIYVIQATNTSIYAQCVLVRNVCWWWQALTAVHTLVHTHLILIYSRIRTLCVDPFPKIPFSYPGPTGPWGGGGA